jgi:hypothetical protein
MHDARDPVFLPGDSEGDRGDFSGDPSLPIGLAAPSEIYLASTV